MVRNRSAALGLILCTASIALAQLPPPPSRPVPVILDTDVSYDLDDAYALAIGFRTQQLGYISIKAITVSTQNDKAASFVNTMLAYGGMTTAQIPIGAFQGTNSCSGDGDNYGSYTTTQLGLVANAGRATFPSATAVLRTVLASAADNSVVIITLGGHSNISLLMQSPADGISPLTGQQLWNQKVLRMISMNVGVPNTPFNDYTSTSWDYNLHCDAAASAYVFSHNGAVPIYIHPMTETINLGGCYDGTGAGCTNTPWPADSPQRVATDRFRAVGGGFSLGEVSGNTTYGRAAWDPSAVFSQAVWGATFGTGPYYTYSPNGTLTVSGTGTSERSSWTTSTQSNHYIDKLNTAAHAVGPTASVMNGLLQNNYLPVPNPRGISLAHPRILATSSRIANWQDLLNNASHPGHMAFLSDHNTYVKPYGDNNLGYNFQVAYFNSTDNTAFLSPVNMAYLYLLTGNTDYADHAINGLLASLEPFSINNGNLTSIVVSGGTATVTNAYKHFITAANGMRVIVLGASDPNLNGTFAVTVTSPTTFTFTTTAANGTYANAGLLWRYAASDGALLGPAWNAATAITGWTLSSGSTYTAHPAFCPTALMYDNVPLTNVTSQADMVPGTWYFKIEAPWPGTLYVWLPDASNPAGHRVEGMWGWGGSEDSEAFRAEAAAIVYDWCYDRIAARNLKPAAINSLKNALGELNDSWYREDIREGVYHNYSVEVWTSRLTIGLALFGDDPIAQGVIDENWGIIAEGYEFLPHDLTSGETYTYNLRTTMLGLTGGALNAEGPSYWRSSAPEILRGIEAYDTATNRTHDVWNSLFQEYINAGYYRIYCLRPDGTMPSIGDASALTFNARDNYAMVMLLNRFPADAVAPYVKHFINTASTSPWWGNYGEGFAYRAMFDDWEGAVAEAADYSALPLSRRFGNMFVMRSGWGADDSYLTFTAGYTGLYHIKNAEQGGFSIFQQRDLVLPGGAYSSTGTDYYVNYFSRSLSRNVPLVYQSNECWRDNTATCGLASSGRALINDGGQRQIARRYNPPFATAEYNINRLWDYSMFSDPRYTSLNYTEQMNSIPTRSKFTTSYDYVFADITKAYSNAFSAPITCTVSSPCSNNHNTNARVTKAHREMVYQRVGKGGYIVMLDRITAADPGFQKTWQIHTVTPPFQDVSGAWADPTTHGTAVNVSGAVTTSGGEVRLATATAHGWAPDTSVSCSGVGGVPGANGVFYVTVVDSTHATLRDSKFSGTYTSGGSCFSIAGGLTDYNTTAASRIDNGPARLFVSTVLPAADVRYRVVGGNQCTAGYATSCGFEGWAYTDPNNPITSGTNWYEAAAVKSSGLGSRGQWRLEVQPTAPATSDLFLHVMMPTTTSTAAPPAYTSVTGTNVAGVFVADPASPSVSVFTADGSLTPTIMYSFAGAGTVQHTVADLQPGTYSVAQGSTIIATGLVVDANGVAGFTSSGGGTFVVTQVAVTLTAVPSGLEFSCTAGGADSAPQSLTIGANGGMLDNWTAQSAQPWISLSPDSGASAGSAEVTVKCNVFSPDVAPTGTVAISSTTPFVAAGVELPVNVTVYPPPVILSEVLPGGVIATAYSKTLTAAGGQPPYTWELVSGTVCAGLALSTDGWVTGIPSLAQTCSFTVAVSDSGGASAVQPILLVIGDRPPSITGAAAATGSLRIQ